MANYIVQTVDGFRIPVSFPSENFLSMKTFKPYDDDIFIVTFPKCGTTWMMYILYLIRHDCPTEKFKMDDYIPHIEQFGAESLNAYPRPRILKTHLPFDRLPWNDKSKYIFIVRNPFDCCVSFYHHTVGFKQHYKFEDGTFDDYFDIFLHGTNDFNDYFDHLNSLYKERNRQNVLFLTYEGMKENPKQAIVDVAKFLGGDFQRKIADEAFLDKVVDMSSFTSMQKKDTSFHSGRPDDLPFVRKGVIGDYRNLMSEEHVRLLSSRFEEKCEGSDVLKLWEQYGIPCKQ